jgi:hypothetical protein
MKCFAYFGVSKEQHAIMIEYHSSTAQTRCKCVLLSTNGMKYMSPGEGLSDSILAWEDLFSLHSNEPGDPQDSTKIWLPYLSLCHPKLCIGSSNRLQFLLEEGDPSGNYVVLVLQRIRKNTFKKSIYHICKGHI